MTDPITPEEIAELLWRLEEWLASSNLHLVKMSQEQGNAEPPPGWIVQLERDALCGETDVIATERGTSLFDAMRSALKLRARESQHLAAREYIQHADETIAELRTKLERVNTFLLDVSEPGLSPCVHDEGNPASGCWRCTARGLLIRGQL